MKRLLALTLALLMIAWTVALGEGVLRLTGVEQVPNSADVQLYINADESPDVDSLTVVLGDGQLLTPSAISKIADTGEGMATVFCIDVSGTISEEDIAFVRNMVSDCAAQLGPNDVVQVYSIGEGAVPLCADYTRDAAEIQAALDALPHRTRKTYLWQCVRMAAQDLIECADALPKHARIIVFSDGQDDSDHAYSCNDALDGARAAGVPVLAVAMNSSEAHVDSVKLQWLCEESGGEMFDGVESIADGLDALRREMDQDYCVTVAAPYAQLEKGAGLWTVQQNMIRSNSLSCTLTTDGVAKPAPKPIYVPVQINGATAGMDVLRVPYADDITISLNMVSGMERFDYRLYGPDGSVLVEDSDSVGDQQTVSMTVRGYQLPSEAIHRFEITAYGTDGGVTTRTVEFCVEPIPVDVKLVLGDVAASDAEEPVAVPYSAMKGYMNFTWSVRNAETIEGALSLADGTQLSSWDFTNATQVALRDFDIDTGVEYVFTLKALAKNGDAASASIHFILNPVDLDVTVRVNGEAAQAEPIRLPYGPVRLTWSGRNAERIDVALTAADGTVLQRQEDAQENVLTLEAAQLKTGERYTITATATAEDGSSRTSAAEFVVEPIPVALELKVNGEAVQTQDVLHLPHEAVSIEWTQALAESCVATLTASDGAEVALDIADQRADIPLDAVIPGEIYTFAVTATAEDGSTAEQQLQFTVDYAPVTHVELIYREAPLDVDQVLKLKEDAAEISVAAEGSVERYEFAAVDSNGEDASAILTASSLGENCVTLNRSAMKPGALYSLTFTAHPMNRSAEAMSLTLQVSAPSRKLMWICIGAGAGVLLLILVLVLALRKKSKPDGDTTVPPMPPAPPVPSTPLRPSLELSLTQDAKGEPPTALTLNVTGKALIGRSQDADLYFADVFEYARTVSRQQAHFVVDAKGKLYLRPRPGTKNPTCVDGVEIQDQTELKVGSVITMGDVTLTLNAIRRLYDD